MVKICDAIMGTGKSSAAINYMNSNNDKRFVYITPYLDEASRIKQSCPSLDFVEPSDKIKQYGFKKSVHTMELLKQGRNIATTHQAFKNYTSEMLEYVTENGYTLIIDENVDILEMFPFNSDDIKIAINAGLIKYEDGFYKKTDLEYNGDFYHDLMRMLDSRDLIHIKSEKDDLFYYWVLPSELILAFEDVFVLTYLFKSQSIHHFLEMYKIPYTYIGIEKVSERNYVFSDSVNYVPEYTTHIKDMLHIVDKDSINKIGDDRYALSANWFKRYKDTDTGAKLKNNLYNYFNNMSGGNKKSKGAGDRLWGGFNSSFEVAKGKGYTNSFLTFNVKATNEYKDRTSLAYIANIFMNPNEKKLYEAHGIEVDEDMYALSIMIQWIWRSAIRDGNSVEIYIPSRRMRNLLIDWMNDLDKGGDGVG